MIWDEFLRHFRFCDEEDSGLSDEGQERKGPKNRPKHTRKRIHQAKKNFLEKFKTASKWWNFKNAQNKLDICPITNFKPDIDVDTFIREYYRKQLSVKETLKHSYSI